MRRRLPSWAPGNSRSSEWPDGYDVAVGVSTAPLGRHAHGADQMGTAHLCGRPALLRFATGRREPEVRPSCTQLTVHHSAARVALVADRRGSEFERTHGFTGYPATAHADSMACLPAAWSPR